MTTQQLAFGFDVPAPAEEEARTFVRGLVVARDGMAQYVHLIRAANDPERSPRPVGGREDRAPHLTLAEVSVEVCREQLLTLLGDGRARTFNAMGVELLDHTADTLFGSPYDAALWQLVSDDLLEHTLEAPILFRLAGSEGRAGADQANIDNGGANGER
jgi:hypothetical protein